MEASRRQTIDARDDTEYLPENAQPNQCDVSIFAQYSTTTTGSNTLASFLAGSGRQEELRDVRSSERVSRLRKQKEEASAAINALNQFIFVAGHTFKGRQLNPIDQRRLRDAAGQVGLSLDVVDALVEQTSDPNAVLNYCMASDDAFATRMKNDPQLSRLLATEARKEDWNGFDVADSVWRIFMHKIIQQFLKDHEMQLSDVMSKESLTSRLYEEALRNEKKSSIDYGNDQLQLAQIQRDYTKERERLKIPEEEAKIARQKAEANMNFQVNRSLVSLNPSDSQDFFVPKDQTVTTDDILSIRPGIYPADEDSVEPSGAGDGVQTSKVSRRISPPAHDMVPTSKVVANDGEGHVSAVKRGLAMFEKIPTTCQVDAQRPRRRSLEVLEQSKILVSKAKFEAGQEEKRKVENRQSKRRQRTSIAALQESRLVNSDVQLEGMSGQCEDSSGMQNRPPPATAISTPKVRKLNPNATKFFEYNDATDRIKGHKPDNGPGADMVNKSSKGNFVKSARQMFERHAGEISEGESKPGRCIKSSNEMRENPRINLGQKSVPKYASRFYTDDQAQDTRSKPNVEDAIHVKRMVLPAEQDIFASQRPEFVVLQANSGDSNGIFSAITQSGSSSPEAEQSHTRRQPKGRSRRRSHSAIMEASKYREGLGSFAGSGRRGDAEENDIMMTTTIRKSLERAKRKDDHTVDEVQYLAKISKRDKPQNDNASLNDYTLSMPHPYYKQNDPKMFDLPRACTSQNKNTALYHESRDDEAEFESERPNHYFPSCAPSSSRRPDRDFSMDEDEGWVDFGIGFIRPPRRSSLGGRSGRGLSEGENESLRQPVSPKPEPGKLLLEKGGIENLNISGKSKDNRQTVVERAESWKRNVRTLLSDEEQPGTPGLQKRKAGPVPTPFNETSKTEAPGDKENYAQSVQSSRWIKFEDNPFVGRKEDSKKNTKRKAQEFDGPATVDFMQASVVNPSGIGMTATSEASPNKEANCHQSKIESVRLNNEHAASSGNIHDLERPPKEQKNSLGHDVNNDVSCDPPIVVWSADVHHSTHRSKTQVAMNREFKAKKVLSHGSYNEFHSDSPIVVWSNDMHYSMDDFRGGELKAYRKGGSRECQSGHLTDVELQHTQGSNVHVAQQARGHDSNYGQAFRQGSLFDGHSFGLYGQMETTRSTSSESDFDAVNAYNESDVRRIESIQASSEHVRTPGSSNLCPGRDQDSYAHQQQPEAPLLSNRGFRASDIFGGRSRSGYTEKKQEASMLLVEQGSRSRLNAQMDLSSFARSKIASNPDLTTFQGMYADEDIDHRQQPVMECQIGPDKSCEADINKSCTVGGVRLLETSYQPMNGGPPVMVPVGTSDMDPSNHDWLDGDSHAYAAQLLPDEEFEALNSYLDSYEYEGKKPRPSVPPHTPTGLVRPSFPPNLRQQRHALVSPRQVQNREEIDSLGIDASSSTLSDILDTRTKSSEDDGIDDTHLQQGSSNGDSRDRYLDAEPGFDEHVQGPTSPTQLRSSDSESTVDEEDIRRAAERRGLSPDVVEVLINHSNSKIRRVPLKGTGEIPHLNDYHRYQEAPIDSDTCRPASARHLRKEIGPDAYDQVTSWGHIAGSQEHDQSYGNYPHPPPDCPPPDPSPREAQAILAALQESAADVYNNRRASLSSVLGGLPEIPEGATEEELNLLNRFIEVAASNFDGKKLSVDSEKRVRAAAEKVGLSQKFVDQLLGQANANNGVRNSGSEQGPVPSVGVPTSPLDDESTYFTHDKTHATDRVKKHSKDVGCNAWEQWDNLTNLLRQWANCGDVGDVHHDDDEDDEDLDDGSTIESEDRYRDELTKKLRKSQRKKKKRRMSKKSAKRGFV